MLVGAGARVDSPGLWPIGVLDHSAIVPPYPPAMGTFPCIVYPPTKIVRFSASPPRWRQKTLAKYKSDGLLGQRPGGMGEAMNTAAAGGRYDRRLLAVSDPEGSNYADLASAEHQGATTFRRPPCGRFSLGP